MLFSEQYAVSVCAQRPEIVKMCREAIQIQSAPNLLGLSLAFHEHLVAIGGSHDWTFCLPCVRLWMHQMCHLSHTGPGLEGEEWQECLNWCERVETVSKEPKAIQAAA